MPLNLKTADFKVCDIFTRGTSSAVVAPVFGEVTTLHIL